jgi:hypothetical protein
VVRADGGILGAGRAVLFILEHTGMPRLARIASRRPFIWLVELGYRAVARRTRCPAPYQEKGRGR